YCKGFRIYGWSIWTENWRLLERCRSELNAQNQRLPRGRIGTIVKTMVSIDFFTVPTIRFQVLYVFLVLAHDRRRVVHFNVTAHPTAEWTAQLLREAFPFDQVPKYLLRDRDRIFGVEFSREVADLGIEEVLLGAPIAMATSLRRTRHRHYA